MLSTDPPDDGQAKSSPNAQLHQECGSNQSGSDSGLGGCTNSISSENFDQAIKTAAVDPSGESEDGKHRSRSEGVATSAPVACSSVKDVPILKSALRKRKAAEPAIKTNRNVSFNQTVIVFCEEIETSSPSEFDPPIDYRDAPDCTNGRPENAARPSDLDLLTKIVGKDASKLTDDQLFGLLESVNTTDHHDGILDDDDGDDADDCDSTAGRMRSDHSYLCLDAICDSDSESSTVNYGNKLDPHKPSGQTVNPVPDVQQDQQQKRQVSRENVPASRDLEISDKETQQRSKGRETNATVSQNTLPARMRVSTVENHPKKTSDAQELGDQRSNNSNLSQPLPPNNPACHICRAIESTRRPANVSQNLSLNEAQIVYVVDQNGNRIRALQVVRPPQSGNQLAPQPPRQVLLAPAGLRPPNPSSVPNQQFSCSSAYANQNIPCSSVNTIPIRVARQPIIASSSSISERNPHGFQGMRIAGGGQSIHPNQRILLPNQEASRNHTIYYVRQPLVMQNSRIASEPSPSSGTKSFPDVHEIRRLDGIWPPTASLQGKHEDSEKRAQNLNSLNSVAGRRDDTEDPSFGFSKRPAVKVVASTANSSSAQAPLRQAKQKDSAALYHGASNQLRDLGAGAQTLDRKQTGRALKQNQTSKDGIPNTSSMSNINQTLVSHHDDSVATDHSVQAKSKGMKLKRWLSSMRRKD